MKAVAGDRLHFRTAAAGEIQIGSNLAQRSHQGGAVFVAARFARDKVNAHFIGGVCFRTPHFSAAAQPEIWDVRKHVPPSKERRHSCSDPFRDFHGQLQRGGGLKAGDFRGAAGLRAFDK